MASYIELSTEFCDLYLSFEHQFIVAVVGRFIVRLSVANAATCLSCGVHNLAIVNLECELVLLVCN